MYNISNSPILGVALIVLGLLTIPMCDYDITVAVFVVPIGIYQAWDTMRLRRRSAKRATKKAAKHIINISMALRKVAAMF